MPTPGPIYRFSGFEANPRTGELLRNGERLRVQEQPFQVLIALLERPGDVVTRDELRLRLWPSDTFVDFDHGLNTTINKLREVLGDSASAPRFIETLPRRGYRFLAAVETENLEPQTAAPAETAEYPAVAPKTVEHATPVATQTAPRSELPDIHPTRATVLFALMQIMYVIFYAIALWRLDEAGWRLQRYLGVPATAVIVTVLVTASVGLALRLYTLTAVLFRYRWLGRNFRRVFPAVLVLDILWAFSPFFLIHLIGIGMAFAASAALVYSPFAQRVLATLSSEE